MMAKAYFCFWLLINSSIFPLWLLFLFEEVTFKPLESKVLFNEVIETEKQLSEVDIIKKS